MTSRVARASDLGSISYGRVNRAQFEMMRGDFERAAPQGKAFADAVRENNSPQWEALVVSLDGWGRWHEGDRDAGRARMREGVAKLDQLHFVPFDGLFKGTLAALETEGGDLGAALSLIDSAIAVSDRTGFCNFDAEVHRIRGEILLKNTTPPTPLPPKPPSSLPSPSRNSKRPAASSCVPRCRWPSSTSPPAARSTPTPSSRPRSKALR